MKTISLKRSKGENSPARNKFLVAFFLCAVLALAQWIFPNVLFRIVYAVSIPFTSFRDAALGELSSIGTYFESKSSLAAKNAELENDLAAINVRLLSMQALESENQALENIVSGKQPTAAKTTPPAGVVFAAVTDKPPFSPYDTLTVSSGSDSGIALDNPVFSDDGTPIGAVEAVFPSSAKVILFSSPGTVMPVVIGDKKFQAAAIGKGGGNFSIKVPTASAPHKGDAVYIPQFSPAALGVVEDVSAEPTDAFATVLFSFPENIFGLSFVTVDTAGHFQISQNAYEATTTRE